MEQTQPNTKFNFTIGKLIIMGVLSIVMYISVVMSVLTPYPVALAFILFGRTKGYAIAGVSIIAFYALVGSSAADQSFIGLYLWAILMAIGLGEMILRKTRPLKALLILGMIFITLGVGFFFSYQQSRGMNTKELVMENLTVLRPLFDRQIEEIQKSGAENSLELISYLKQPELMADDIIKQGPSLFVMGLFVVLWANMFLLLKSKRIFGRFDDEYSEKLLIRFRMRDEMVIIVIAGLILAMWGDYLHELAPVIGMSALKILGVFYFFQGFGIYIDFLDYYRVAGFFRTMLVVLTVLSGYPMLALIGVFDTFFNFRKFLKKKEDLI